VTDATLRLAFGGLHPERLQVLNEEWGSPDAVLRAILKRQIQVVDRIREAVEIPAAVRRRQLEQAAMATIIPGEPGYPESLAVLPDRPPLLFVRGTIPSEPAVAVVGSRRCTSYGRRYAELYGQAIAEAGWVAVSGLARGIDGAVHRGTVAIGGLGIGVLGCGLDVAYPREHATLASDLLKAGGAVVSEYPPGTPPNGWRFPPRNRIISGLSAAVVVVEATVKGGALITAARALDHGIPVLATPGDIDRESSRGANLLIRDGAIPVLDPDDLVMALSLVLGPPQRPPQDDASAVFLR
jgi:DNA processing protein